MPAKLFRQAIPGLALALGLLMSVPASPALADTAAGEILAQPCFACHGPQGQSIGDIPGIHGKSGALIASVMREFRNGEREGTLMDRIARGYSDEEIAALAAYFDSHR